MENYAVIVGVSNYYDSQIKNLPHSVYTTENLLNVLIKKGNFKKSNIQVLKDDKKVNNPLLLPLKYSVISSILNIHNKMKIKQEDFFLFYFIGHGYGSLQKGDQILLKDTCFQFIQDTALSAAALTKLIDPIPAKRKLLVFDACRNEVEGALGTQEGLGKTKIDEFLTLYACMPVNKLISQEVTDCRF